MNSPSAIVAAGWISIPVSDRETYASTRGTTGTLASSSAWATRWESSACTPGQAASTSAAETPLAAGSRSYAARTSRRSSPATRRRVPIPNTPYSLRRCAVRAVRAAPDGHAQEVMGREVDLQERVGQRAVEPREQLQRLERLQGPDHAGRRAEHAGLRARRHRAGRRRLRERAAVARGFARPNP